ncbi:MAG: hypothetical protein PHT88_03710 [Candidatus Moranbacteria bacterium]|nr:hypothetical protein [Candidatus Moranbacteria bacterium]
MSKNLFENPYRGNGLAEIHKTGLTAGERAAEGENNQSYLERAGKLKAYAEKIAHDTRTAILVHGLLREVGDLKFLTDEKCDKFAEEHPSHFDEGPAVLAVAIALEAEKRSTH